MSVGSEHKIGEKKKEKDKQDPTLMGVNKGILVRQALQKKFPSISSALAHE